ncbi:MAG: NmrA family NAD(P)-binding protein [Bacteroidota bacterium]
MKDQKILILGGTGKTGRRVVEQLTKLNIPTVIGSRSATPSFDWDKPELWPNVLEGVTTAYITYQPDLAVPGASDAITEFTQKALEAGVKKVVLLSGKGEKEAEFCEEIVKNSGLDYTIVRASWFNQNFNEGFFIDPILAGVVALPKSEVGIPFVDVDDIAEVVVKALTESDHNGKTYQLTGPRQLTFREAVTEISEASGRDIKFIPVTMEAYKDMLHKHEVPETYIWLITYLFEEVLTEENSEITSDIQLVLNRKATDFSTYAKRVAATQVWNSVFSPIS